MNITSDRFTTDPNLAGGVYGRSSYLPVRAVLKASRGEPLSPAERIHFDKLGGGREPPREQVSELVIAAGRASGKTQAAAGIIVYLATCQEWRVDPGQVPMALLLAADREQAAVAFRFVLGLLESSPVLSQEIASQTANRIVLRTGVEIHIATSDYRAVRGRSIICAVCDELAFWPITPESVSPDTEVLIALRPGLARFPRSMLVCISSVYAQSGALYEYDRRFFGQNDARVLVVKGGTRDFNAQFPQDTIDAALRDDPAAAAAEYLSQYRTDRMGFIDASLLDSVTRSEPRELPRRLTTASGTPIIYMAGIDVSGGRGDAAACAVAHLDGDKAVIDACRRWPAPHDPIAVAASVAEFLKGYGLSSAVGDHYGAELARTIYAEAGVSLNASDLPRSDVYLRMLPLLTTGRIELPPDPMLRVEMIGLERRTSRAGKDSIDHRPGGHDDLANATALAAVAASRTASIGDTTIYVAPSDFFDGFSVGLTGRNERYPF